MSRLQINPHNCLHSWDIVPVTRAWIAYLTATVKYPIYMYNRNIILMPGGVFWMMKHIESFTDKFARHRHLLNNLSIFIPDPSSKKSYCSDHAMKDVNNVLSNDEDEPAKFKRRPGLRIPRPRTPHLRRPRFPRPHFPGPRIRVAWRWDRRSG